jgi:hypothetical protein
VAALPTPAQRTYYKDTVCRALHVVALPTGTKAFELYRKVSGKPTRIGLGHFDPTLPDARTFPKGSDPLSLVGNSPKLSVAMARLMASALNLQLDMGINLVELKRVTRKAKMEELTLQEAFDRYEADHLIPNDKRTTNDLRYLFERHLECGHLI